MGSAEKSYLDSLDTEVIQNLSNHPCYDCGYAKLIKKGVIQIIKHENGPSTYTVKKETQ